MNGRSGSSALSTDIIRFYCHILVGTQACFPVFALVFLISLHHFLPHCPVNDTLDDIFDGSGDEEESQDIVNQVLDEIGIEISGKVRNSKQLKAASLYITHN